MREFAQARAETARYRELVVDLENNAPPPLLDGPNTPDDLKLIVGIGPVLERMLHQLGVATYRQIARWSERDIDEFDASCPNSRAASAATAGSRRRVSCTSRSTARRCRCARPTPMGKSTARAPPRIRWRTRFVPIAC